MPLKNRSNIKFYLTPVMYIIALFKGSEGNDLNDKKKAQIIQTCAISYIIDLYFIKVKVQVSLKYWLWELHLPVYLPVLRY